MKLARAFALTLGSLCSLLALTSCNEQSPIIQPSSPIQSGSTAQASPAAQQGAPGTVMGTATFEDGRPIPSFTVSCGGVVHFGTAQGTDGHYALQVPADALVSNLSATATVTYEGNLFVLTLNPTDGQPDWPNAGGYRADASKGVVRNFTLKMTGLIPGQPPQTPDFETSGNGQVLSHYGGELDLNCSYARDYNADPRGTTSIGAKYPGAKVTLTFTPTGPLVDGSAGRVVTRTLPLTGAMELYGLPIGPYSMTASMTDSGGQVHPLVARSTYPSTPGEWTASIPLDWTQDSHGALVGQPNPVRLYLAE